MAEEEIRKVESKNEAEKLRQNRTKTLLQSYYDYLMDRVMTLEKEHPTVLRAFLDKYVEENAQIKGNDMFESHLKERLLADSELREDFINRFQVFFDEITLDDWLHPEQVES